MRNHSLITTMPHQRQRAIHTRRSYTGESRFVMGIRRNFIHNCIVHPFCGVVWLIADVGGLLGLYGFKNALVSFGERIHKEN